MINNNWTTLNAPMSELGEGPMWSIQDQVLYWLDIVSKRLFCYNPNSGKVETRDLPYSPSAIIPRVQGGLLLITKKGMVTMEFDQPHLNSVPLPLVDFKQEVFNDAKCDCAGRLWVGTRDIHVKNPMGRLFKMETDFSMQIVRGDLIVSNGLAWSPSGNTFYHVDSRPGRIDSYDFDPIKGSLSNPRIFRDYPSEGAKSIPDGCTTDVEGGLWVAEVGDWHIRRYSPEGKLDREIKMPFKKPSSVMFGGPNLDQLFVSSMRFGLSEQELLEQPLAGSMLQLDVGVKGLPEFAFAG